MIINTFEGRFSVHKSTINLSINGEDYDISYLFPKHSYSQWELCNPEVNWKVRKMMREQIVKYIQGLDSNFPADRIIC
jgi:hypothetical protein